MSSYIPDSKTNFEIECPNGEYLSGALCYRDCNKIGLSNCGIGACAGGSDYCATSIAMMAIDFAFALFEGVTFLLTFGTSSSLSSSFKVAKDKIREAMKDMGKSEIKKQV